MTEHQGSGDPGGTAPDSTGYADAVAELDRILAELDGDDVDIDTLADRVERAAELIALCRTRLDQARLRVSEIVAGLDDGSVVDRS